MVEITYQVVLDTLQTVGILIGIFYYLKVLRNQQKNQEISLKNQELTLQSQELSRKALEQSADTRQAQLFMHLYDEYMAKEFMSDTWELYQMQWINFDDFALKYDSSVNIDNFEKRYKYWTYFNGMGMLLKKGLIDIEMLYFLMGGYGALWMWEKFKDIIYEARIRMNEPDHLVMFEYLADEMLKMREQRGHQLDIPESWGVLTPKSK